MNEVIEYTVLSLAILGAAKIAHEVHDRIDDQDFGTASKVAIASGAGMCALIITPVGAAAGAVTLVQGAQTLWAERDALKADIKARWAAERAKQAGGPKAVA